MPWPPAGCHPFHAPCGILLDDANRPASQCIRCTWCDGYPCLVHARSDADVIAVRPLLDQPNVTLLVNAEVQRRDPAPVGPGPAPGGPGQRSGEVGRNYMYHNSKAVVALGKERNDTGFEKTLGLNDFYFAGDGREWPLGNIQMCGSPTREAMKGEEPKLTKLAPGLEPGRCRPPRRRLLADHGGRPRSRTTGCSMPPERLTSWTTSTS